MERWAGGLETDELFLGKINRMEEEEVKEEEQKRWRIKKEMTDVQMEDAADQRIREKRGRVKIGGWVMGEVGGATTPDILRHTTVVSHNSLCSGS